MTLFTRSCRAVAALVVLGATIAGCTGSSDPSATGASSGPLFVPQIHVFSVTANGRSGTKTETLTSVQAVGRDRRETIGIAETGQPEVSLVYVFHSDGSISDPTTTTTSTNGSRLTLQGPTVPSTATLDSLRPVRETRSITLTVAKRTIHTDCQITVQGGTPTTVRVPAGTFSARPVHLTLDYTLLGDAVAVRDTDYVAPHVGTVEVVSVETSGGKTVQEVDKLIKISGGTGLTVL